MFSVSANADCIHYFLFSGQIAVNAYLSMYYLLLKSRTVYLCTHAPFITTSKHRLSVFRYTVYRICVTPCSFLGVKSPINNSPAG